MACLQALKQDIKILESLFKTENERFKVLSASVDEVTCEFTGANGERVRINANITETYPQTAPIWFCDDDNVVATAAVEKLSNMPAEKNNILQQVKVLITELCSLSNVPEPEELQSLDEKLDERGMLSVDQSSESEEEDELHYDMEEDVPSDHKSKEEVDGIDTENLAVLERLKQSQRDEYLKQFDEKIFNATASQKLGEKKKKEAYKKLVSGVIGKTLGEQFKKEVHYTCLPKLFRSYKPRPPTIDELESKDIGLCTLFKPEHNGTN